MHQRQDGGGGRSNPNFGGEYDETSGIAGFLEQNGVAAADSMEIKNDPRFFQDNVINYRLSAFGGTAIVSGLMVGNCMSQMWDMDKNMQVLSSQGKLFHWNGLLQLIAFTELLIIFFANMVSTYVGVAQPYHTIRLLTAGPTGFETAASYYLNRNIVAWRHSAIKYMLLSIPLYVSQMGVRLIVKFDRSNKLAEEPPDSTPIASQIQGIIFCACMLLLAYLLYSVHQKHFEVFRDRYETMARSVTGNDFSTYMRNMMTSGRAYEHLDV